MIQEGKTITVLAPYAVASLAGVKVGNLFGVANFTAGSGAQLEIVTVGVHDLTKDTSTFSSGDSVYWDDTAKKATSTASGNIIIGGADLTTPSGTAALGGSSGDATVRVRLNGMSIGTVASANLDSAVLSTATVSLTAANILGMNVTPFSVIAAPGAGKAIVVDNLLFAMTRTSTQFANGGTVNLQYHTTTSSNPLAGTVPAATVTGSVGAVQTYVGPNVGATGLALPSNEGIDITNAAAPFITGTGTAKVFIKYRIITL